AAELYGLGRTALARGDYQRAVASLEEASKQDPSGSSIHYPLAMAYRALHRSDKVEEHLRQRGDAAVAMADPLIEDLSGLLRTAVAYEGRGDRALDNQRWADAVRDFR